MVKKSKKVEKKFFCHVVITVRSVIVNMCVMTRKNNNIL